MLDFSCFCSFRSRDSCEPGEQQVGSVHPNKGEEEQMAGNDRKTQSCSFPFCNNSKKHSEIFSGSISHSTLMFLWRKELQIHEHRLFANAVGILEQVNDLIVFVCHSSQAGLCLCVF